MMMCKRLPRLARLTLIVVLCLPLLLSQSAAARPVDLEGSDPPVVALAPAASSQPLISYQGTLANPDGTPVNATLTMGFALHSAAEGSALVWGPETHTVTVTKGQFTALLGETVPLSAGLLNGNLWLDITVNGEHMSPREKMTEVPYAFEAHSLAPWALAKWRLTVNEHLYVRSPDAGIYGMHLERKDNASRTHTWTWWHMNTEYGENALSLWEYRTDGAGKMCDGDRSAGAMCDARLTVRSGGQLDLLANLNMNGNSIVGCGALTEANLQTPEELAAGGSDRFEQGDLLCWGIDQLELCATENDRLVQAVSDKSGNPIVIGAEPVKVLGPVTRGDILVASDVPGYAMVDNDPISGSVIAQALEDFKGERGIIKAMIRKF